MENEAKTKAIELGDTALKKRLFLEAFAEAHGIIEYGVRRANIVRQTYYNWRRSDPDFNLKCIRILEEQPDFVEDILLKQINDGDGAAVRYYLSHKHARYKDDGNRLKKTENTEQPVTLEELLDSSPLTKIEIHADPNTTNDQRAADTPAAENTNETRADSTV